jgi:hypothetical protein
MSLMAEDKGHNAKTAPKCLLTEEPGTSCSHVTLKQMEAHRYNGYNSLLGGAGIDSGRRHISGSSSTAWSTCRCGRPRAATISGPSTLNPSCAAQVASGPRTG